MDTFKSILLFTFMKNLIWHFPWVNVLLLYLYFYFIKKTEPLPPLQSGNVRNLRPPYCEAMLLWLQYTLWIILSQRFLTFCNWDWVVGNLKHFTSHPKSFLSSLVWKQEFCCLQWRIVGPTIGRTHGQNRWIDYLFHSPSHSTYASRATTTR